MKIFLNNGVNCHAKTSLNFGIVAIFVEYVELVGYEDEEAGRSLRLQSWDVHEWDENDHLAVWYDDLMEK